MKILLTGAFGFVGSNLTDTLNKEHHLYALDIVSVQKKGVIDTFKWSEIDNIPTVDIIIHLAGKAHDTNNSAEEVDYYDVNVGLTRKIFQFFLNSSAKKFIFFSSVKAIADSVDENLLTENLDPRPMTAYGKSKLSAENYILEEWDNWKRNYNRLHKQEQGIDKSIYILRPCMIHGPGNKGNLNLLYKFSKKGIPWPLGSFENKRSFSSIDNVTYVIEKLIENPIESGIYNLADDDPVSTNDIIQLMASSQNKQARIWKISPNFIRVVAKAGDMLNLPLNSERLKKLTESYLVSNQKVKLALGIEKMPVTAIDGLHKTLSSFKN